MIVLRNVNGAGKPFTLSAPGIISQGLMLSIAATVFVRAPSAINQKHIPAGSPKRRDTA